jgi:hypothetical protein
MYDGVALPTFTQDSKHFLFIAQNKNLWFVVVDGVEGKERFLGFIKGSEFRFENNNTSAYILALHLPPVSTLGPNMVKLKFTIPD